MDYASVILSHLLGQAATIVGGPLGDGRVAVCKTCARNAIHPSARPHGTFSIVRNSAPPGTQDFGKWHPLETRNIHRTRHLRRRSYFPTRWASWKVAFGWQAVTPTMLPDLWAMEQV